MRAATSLRSNWPTPSIPTISRTTLRRAAIDVTESGRDRDAPALATADVGIAMGAAGTDIAIEAADVAIMGDDLTHLPDLIVHARRTRTIMLQNLVLSGLIIAVLIPVAAAGWLGLGAVVAIHELAEIVVIVNALRARRSLRTGGGTGSYSTSHPTATNAQPAHV